MKLKRKGNFITAFAESSDDLSNTGFKVGDSMGKINVTTGKFTGATKCMIALTEYRLLILNKPRTKLILTIELEFDVTGSQPFGVLDEHADTIALNVQHAIENKIENDSIVPDEAEYFTKSVKVLGGKLE